MHVYSPVHSVVHCMHVYCFTISLCFCTVGDGHTEEDKQTKAKAKAAAGKIFTCLFQNTYLLMSTICVMAILHYWLV